MTSPDGFPGAAPALALLAAGVVGVFGVVGTILHFALLIPDISISGSCRGAKPQRYHDGDRSNDSLTYLHESASTRPRGRRLMALNMLSLQVYWRCCVSFRHTFDFPDVLLRRN